MALSKDAEDEFRQLLRDFHAAHSGVLTPTAGGKALEAWVLMKLAHTVRRWNPQLWVVTMRRGDGTPLPHGAPFTLSSQHSPIRPSGLNAPGHILLERIGAPNRCLEIHGGIQWEGRSGARHEIDVSVLPRNIGSALRSSGGGYPHGLPIAAVECKDKAGCGTLDEVRQTLARMYDLALVTQPSSVGACRIFESKSSQRWGRKSSRYITYFKKGTFAIVRAGSFQSGTAALTNHYSILQCPNVYANPATINRLQAAFRKMLGKIAYY